MEEMIFNLADTHLFFNDLEVSSVVSYILHVIYLKNEEGSYNSNGLLFLTYNWNDEIKYLIILNFPPSW